MANKRPKEEEKPKGGPRFPIQLWLDEADAELLKDLAAQAGVSRQECIRQLIRSAR